MKDLKFFHLKKEDGSQEGGRFIRLPCDQGNPPLQLPILFGRVIVGDHLATEHLASGHKQLIM